MTTYGRIILASASRSRAAILSGAAIPFEIWPSQVDEEPIKTSCRANGRSAADCAMRLATEKARAVSEYQVDAWVVGADQMLHCQGRWFDKPGTVAEAREHLTALRGHTHELITAVCLFYAGRMLWKHEETISLTMRPFSDAFLDSYLEKVGGDITTTVGAYRLEGFGAHLFERIEGDYFTILGLPLLPLLAALREHEIID